MVGVSVAEEFLPDMAAFTGELPDTGEQYARQRQSRAELGRWLVGGDVADQLLQIFGDFGGTANTKIHLHVPHTKFESNTVRSIHLTHIRLVEPGSFQRRVQE